MRLIVISIIVGLSGCGYRHVEDGHGNIPFVAIMSNLGFYDKKKVSFVTYGTVRFEEQAAYISNDDAGKFLFTNALWLELPDNMDQSLWNTEGIYQINGVIDLTNPGHMGMYIGSVTVTKIDEVLLYE